VQRHLPARPVILILSGRQRSGRAVLPREA